MGSVRRFATGGLGAAAVAACVVTLSGQQPGSAPVRRPTLLVVMAVDQMRGDYIERYGQQWTSGLRRLVDQGASFPLAAYPFLGTVTCAGHATIGTGAFPRTHGIVLNEWWDRAGGRLEACTDDPHATAVSYGKPVTGGHSARLLRVPTLADELRLQLPVRPRVASFSMKPRSAIMPAGQRADALLWFDDEGEWATSSAYASAPVPFLQRLIAANPIARQFQAVWERTLPLSAYLYEDAAPGENPPPGWTATFPHPIAGDGASSGTPVERWDRSPFSDEYLGLLVETAIDELKLGQGPGIDYLAVSFSALDRVGHRFGPRSHEVQDTLVRLDRTIGRVLDHLDRAVGRDGYVLGFSADHGVAPLAEQAQAEGIDAGRLPPARIGEAANRALEPILGPGPHVARTVYTDLYFTPGTYDRLREDPRAMQAVIDAIQSVDGVARVYRKEDLRSGSDWADPLKRAAALSYFEGRSGDLVVVPRPFFSLSSEPTTHGTAYRYDTHVPLILYGAGIRSGRYLSTATPADLAPTLGFLAGITMAAADGRVLSEALSPEPAPGARRPAAAPAKKN